MTVYVDNAFIPATVGRHTSRWCHLTADSHDELMEFATVKLRLLPQHLQAAGTHREHFDLTEPKRELALKLGARAISTEEAAPLRALGRSGVKAESVNTAAPMDKARVQALKMPPPMLPTPAEHIAARDTALKQPSSTQVIESLLATIASLRRAVALARPKTNKDTELSSPTIHSPQQGNHHV